MAGMGPRDQKRLIKALERQGCTVRPLGRGGGGYFIKFPNGGSTTLHSSVSDTNGWKNKRRDIERAGLVWPPELKG